MPFPGICLLTRFLTALTILLLSAPAVIAEPAADVRQKERDRIETIARISPSVVCVMPPGGQGGGSGVLISADGFAISNYHVTSGSGTFMKCGLSDGRVYDAVIVGIDPTGDVALIRLLGRDDFPFAVPGDSDAVRTGDEVLALGNPFLLASDFTPTVTYGIVSGVHRYQYPARTFLEYTDCIQIDASINPGNSGGPLFDINGKWIGINGRASFEKRGRINSGAAYAISVRQVLLFVEHLKSGRIVDHGRTDFTVSTYDGAVQVEQVSQLSEAWRRGLRPGDELLSFADRALASANDFKNIVGIFPEGTRVPMTYRNDEGTHRVTIRLVPLHDFEEAPQLPEERRQSDPDQPDDEPGGLRVEKPPEAPPAYAHLHEDRPRFANYYFNRIATEEILDGLKPFLNTDTDSPLTWTVQVSQQAETDAASGTLTVSAEGAGLDLSNLSPALQQPGTPDPLSESRTFYGLLFGLLQWHDLVHRSADDRPDAVYHGREQLLPSGRDVRVLIIRSGSTTVRWYFSDDSPLPVGADVSVAAGTDEGRLRFEDWQTEQGTAFPGRVGTVDPQTEELRWLKVDALTVRTATEAETESP